MDTFGLAKPLLQPFRVTPAAPGDWRKKTVFGTPRKLITSGSSYTDLLPQSLQNKPAFAGTTSNAFFNQLLGGNAVDSAVNLFGGQGVGTAVYKPGFGQFTADVIPEINAAAAKFGVPANFLMSIIAAESSGNWNRNNFLSNIRPGSGPLMPYVGVFKDAADSRGLGALFQQAIGNRGKQIELLAGVLRSQYDQIRKRDPGYGWSNVASYHYSGRPVPDGWQDESGNGTNNQYMNKIETWWKSLDAFAGNTWNNYTAPSAQPSNSVFNVGAIFGGSPPRISQEFGKTAFSQSGLGQSMYGYAGGLGVQGHAGIDYSMNPGSKLYVPVSGTVITTGGRLFYTDSRYGTRPGTGELRIKLDNGDELILGHMQQINLRVGQRVSPGTLAGLSGTNNGGHVHVEYRQYAPGKTSTNYLALDPRKMLVGGSVPLKSSTVEEKRSYTSGAGLAAARKAALSGSTADLAKLVYNPEFLKTALQRRMAA